MFMSLMSLPTLEVFKQIGVQANMECPILETVPEQARESGEQFH